MAEREGFEPSVRFAAHTRFPSVLFKPLRHLSKRNAKATPYLAAIQPSFTPQTTLLFYCNLCCNKKKLRYILSAMPIKRTTEQRRIIEQICLTSRQPLSIDDILEQGRAKLAKLNRVTVYRNLNRMVEEGTLSRLSHPEKGTLYEQADRPHHHHFFCRVCENAFELPGCGLSEKKQAPAGFVVEGHEVFLHGRCADCTS